MGLEHRGLLCTVLGFGLKLVLGFVLLDPMAGWLEASTHAPLEDSTHAPTLCLSSVPVLTVTTRTRWNNTAGPVHRQPS